MTHSPAEIRQRIIAERRELSAESARELSDRINGRLCAWAEVLPESPRVAMFRCQKGEVILDGFDRRLREMGAQIYYPVVDPRIFGMKMFPAPSWDAPEFPGSGDGPGCRGWKQGAFGILEPECAGLEPVEPASLDLILVPSVAIGSLGERIGMGSGYYDRYLPQAVSAVRVAPIFEFQYFEDGLPECAWDQRVHWAFTEKRELRLERFKS